MLFQKFIDGNFNARLYKGDADQTQTGSQTSTYTPQQQEFYDKLLGQATGWLDQGGIQAGTDYSNQFRSGLEQQQGFYQDMMRGGYDETALNNAMNANAQAATQQFERNVIPTLSSQANLSGGSAGSRRGIAEGLAASDLNQNIANQNAQMIWNAEQQSMQRQMAGAQGLSNVNQGFMQLSDYENRRRNTGLESLLAYKNLIGGNMGGTETGTNVGTSNVEGGGGFI